MEKDPAEPRPRLLFISPTFPSTTGNGLAMRAGAFVEALAQEWHITLLVVPVFGQETPASRALTARSCERAIVLEPRAKAGLPALLAHRFDARPGLMRLFAGLDRAGAKALAGQRFDAIHAFRFYTAPLALSLAERVGSGQRPSLHHDIDDIESSTHARLSELYSLNGRWEDAQVETAESQQYERAERELLPAFDRLYVCSEPDARHVRLLTGADVRVAPNVIQAPAGPIAALTTHPFTFLFVGNLSYYPNEDAAFYFCREVLPRVRAEADGPFRVRLVGTGLTSTFRPLARSGEVRLIGEVPEIGREYADADAVIVPVRAGGGTRIKVLEALAYQRPVVATTAGVEGIDLEPGEHCLIGDTPWAFAGQCLRLMRDRELRDAQARKAYELVTARYSPACISRAVREAP